MLKIVLSPDPGLAQVCEPCDPKDKTLSKLSKQMAHAMYTNDGCGIAAPQVGVNKRLIVIDVDYTGKNDRDPLVMINPEIVELWGDMETAHEGCLSCPGVQIPITRPAFARVQYQDLDGELWEIEGDGLLGRCLQHEIDHLNGKTLFESCTPEVRLRALAAYEEAKAAGARPGETAIVVEEEE
ncbi:MAG: peptide deformylase [Eggerthellaceae bacterium]|nr:peptide deformylase [Eggerthellaceae bacterium]